MTRINKMNLRNLRQKFYKVRKLTINPYPGGELSLWRKKGIWREVICGRSYQSGEETENDLHFSHEYSMERSDYVKALKDLEEKGSCNIPISGAKVGYECRLNPVPDTVPMELQDDGTVKIFGIKTPWTVKQISEDLGKTIK